MSDTSTRQADLGEKFYALHHRGHPFVIPNPWDAGSARILQAKGFEALATTSAGVDHAMGVPAGSAGRDVVLANAAMIAASTDLPLQIDLEDCYGSSLTQIAETITIAAQTGAVGGSIEDARYGSEGEIYEFDEAVERVAAAVEAARALPFRFTLTARCENFLYGNPDMTDTIKRLNAYAEAGADVLYAPGLTSVEEIETIQEAIKKPLNVLLGMANTTLTMADMHRLGVARVSLGSGLHRTAMTAFIRAIDEIQGTGTFSFTGGLKSSDEIDRLVN